jgi:hypothetical protein
MILLTFLSLLSVVVCRVATVTATATETAETTTPISATSTTLEEWKKDEHGMFLASSLEESLVFLQVAHQASTASWQDGNSSPSSSPFSMMLMWVEDAECSVQQNDTVIQAIHAAVTELMMTGSSSHPPIPTLRWTISSSDVQSRLADVKHLLSDEDFDFTRTPGLLVTTCNGTQAHTVHYSGSYHRIPATLHHYYDWLTVWSTSIYDDHHPQAARPAIALDLSKPKTFRNRQDVLAHWDQHYHHPVTVNDDAASTVTTNNHPLLVVYYHQDLSLCPSKQEAAAAMKQQAASPTPWNATMVQEEMKVFDLFAITVAGRRDRYFFYSYDCRPMVHVYDGGPLLESSSSSSSPNETALLLYQWDRSLAAETTLHAFLVQTSSDALITFDRELTYPIAMAHDIQIVALTNNNLLDETWCRQWKRRNYSIICLLVAPNEYRLISALPGLQPDRVVIVAAERRRHVQQTGEMDVDEFVKTTLFTTTRTTTKEGEPVRQQQSDADESTPPDRHAGGIRWIEGPDATFPQRGIVVAVSRTCGHCQRMLAIFARLEGLLQKLRWTEDFPLYVVDVAKTDVAQPVWLPTLYYDGAESSKRTFYDETEILEWVFSQMPDNEVEALQRRLL